MTFLHRMGLDCQPFDYRTPAPSFILPDEDDYVDYYDDQGENAYGEDTLLAQYYDPTE